MTGIFVKNEIVPEMRAERLVSALETYVPDGAVSDNLIFSKILAASKEVERKLRVFLEPVEILPPSVSQQVRDDFDANETRWEDSPGYDWDPDSFRGNKWGYILTRHKPIISVDKIEFIYPVSDTEIFQIPDNWIKLDKKYGQIRLVPSGTPFFAPLNAYILQVAGGGRNIPNLVHIKYVAGLKDVHNEHPDIIDLIKRMAVLKIIEDAFVPQSGSISADGLTQSFSFDVQKSRETVDKDIAAIKSELIGIPFMVL